MKNYIFEDFKLKWTNKTKSQKIKFVVLSSLFVVFTIGTILSYIYGDWIFGEETVFNNDTGNHALNVILRAIPSVIKTIQIIVLGVLTFHIVKWVASLLVSKSNKGLTIVKLLNNFLKYLLAIIIVLCVLSAWGVNTTALVASAGVLSLIVGLGAQSLVSDIIAGIFIVFEGTYKIGDIVVIDGWRGTVSEIGIRTTRIMDAGGNLKIINNSAITSVINQTQELSVAKCIVGIEYGEDLQRVEKVIIDSYPRLKERIPEIVGEPVYKGVTALGESSVDLIIFASCAEENIYSVQRGLNREIKLIFDENNINIPFTQVVIHDAK